jgi:hypothetical protein
LLMEGNARNLAQFLIILRPANGRSEPPKCRKESGPWLR